MKLLSWLQAGSRYRWVLSVLSGLLLWLAWPTLPTSVLLFVAFVPLLVLEYKVSQSSSRWMVWNFFAPLFIALLIWNIGTTWWIYYSTPSGCITAILANTSLMTLPWVLFHLTKKYGGANWGYLGLVLYWVTFEYIHLNWELSWPWLTLGNGLAMFPQWIQWYEYTGVFGGTIWILMANLLIFLLLIKRAGLRPEIKSRNMHLLYVLLWIFLPIAGSYFMYYTHTEQGTMTEVAVIQPNIDPYAEKFIGSDKFIPFDEQVDRFIELSEEVIFDGTAFLLWPESAIDGGYPEEHLLHPTGPLTNGALIAKDFTTIKKIIDFKDRWPGMSLITGLTSYKIYPEQSEKTATARQYNNSFMDIYNTAYFLSDDYRFATYHKTKLVPGPEAMPYPNLFGFLSRFMVDMGGTSGQLGRQQNRSVFFNAEGIGIAPAICYESIYGDFMTRYIRNGAHLIFIITNDGWWGNTQGYKQHLHYARLRAIETRRSIARSANTGISTFINQRGDLVQPSAFWQQVALKDKLQANDSLTFYTRHGDYIARTAAWLAVLVFLSGVVKRKTNR